MTGKFTTADDIAARIGNGATVAITGSGGGLLEPDALLAAIERRFLATGAPRDLTLVHAQGIGDGAERGLNHLAHEGLVRRVIGAHWTWSPRMQALAKEEKIAAYALPGGVIQHLMREIGAGRPGLITKVGLGTFVDPRFGGGAMNASAAAPLVETIEIDGEEYLRFLPFRVDVALVRGTSADPRGNVGFEAEGAELDALVLAIAARNCGGQVFVQVRDDVALHVRPAVAVRLPGTLVDAVALVPDQPWSHHGESADVPDFNDEARPLERRIIAARALDLLRPEGVVSFGFGIPDGVARLARATGGFDHYYTTLDHGHHGGEALQGPIFGFVRQGEARIDSPAQFDFYSGGGIDTAVLGFGEIDGAGNVNVSRLGGRIIGPGGFIEIAHRARQLIFCGTFEGKGLAIAAANDRLDIVRPGSLGKFVRDVEQIAFSGRQAALKGQDVRYVTERALFRLTAEGVVLDEVAPGIDTQRDVIDRMAFMPIIPAGGPAIMPARFLSV